MANGDFYFTLNATFYHFSEQWGDDALIAYWQAIGREYLAPLAAQFQAGGSAAIAGYWRDYFVAEPGGDVTVGQPDEHTAAIEVRDCPAISWLTRSQASATHPPVHPMYCQHCLHINQALMEATDYEFTLEGGGGSCRQTFRRKASAGRSEQEAAR